jgi:carboxypeptidase C (cathepsin A)
MKTLAVWLLLCVAALSPPAFGQQAIPGAGTPPSGSASASPGLASEVEAESVTRHAVDVRGEHVAYTATAGYLPLTDESGKLQARIFFVSYVREAADAGAARPVTFAFNGGPGASSMWLHLGVGPKRVALPADGTRLPQSTVLTENEATWLTFTDLVFVDPVGTGYSRAAEGVDEKQFYEVVRDIEVAAAFVRKYVTHHQRWLSPKFIAGESYGTTRAAALANRLQETAGINVNGLVLVSSVLDFQTIWFQPPNDLAHVLVLPSYAAAVWYHAGQAGSLAAAVHEAEQWAMSEYLVALTKGETIPQPERERVAARLARYTGLEQEELQQLRLRVRPAIFGKQLLRSTGQIVGRFDSRVTAPDSSPGARHTDSDPSFFLVTGPLVEGLNAYLREELQLRSDLRYEYFSREANRAWNWGAGGQGYLYVADELAEAMSRDPRLRVFAAAGYFDLATPYLAQKYTFAHMQLDPGLRGNITFAAYPSGHMIYTEPVSAARLQVDVERFVRCTVAQTCAQEAASAAAPTTLRTPDAFPRDALKASIDVRRGLPRVALTRRRPGRRSAERDASHPAASAARPVRPIPAGAPAHGRPADSRIFPVRWSRCASRHPPRRSRISGAPTPHLPRSGHRMPRRCC